MTRIAQLDFKTKLLFFILVLLGCHQFPVLRVGGSFKTYELLGLLLMFYNLTHSSKFKPLNAMSFWALAFFVLVPVTSYLYSTFFLDYPSGFYSHYISSRRQDIRSFRFNYYLFPILQLLLLAMNYSVFVSFSRSDTIFLYFDKLIKACIAVGTIIAIYSLFALLVVDIIPLLPSIIQNKSEHAGRSTGFSQEPGTYVFYQTWICLFIFFSKRIYSFKVWYILFIINLLSMILTISSTLVGFMIIILFVQFTYRTTVFKQIKALRLILLSIVVFYVVVVNYNLQTTMDLYFVKKIERFLSGHKNDNTKTSGAARAYYNGIGYRIFSDNLPLGVGQGRSQYYMYLYEYKMGIKHFGERLEPGTTPMGVLPMVMAEDGIAGLIALSVFYFLLIRKFWINRNKSDYHKMFLIGNIFLGVFFFTLFPVYHLFFWGYAGFGLGYLRYFDRQKSKINQINEISINNSLQVSSPT